jgi:hypothetical protein
MYRPDDFVGGEIIKARGDYHHLAECIRRGCKLRPKKARRHFRRGDKTACALGAAAAGLENRRSPQRFDWRWIREVFPETYRLVTDPLTNLRMDLGCVISRLNDETDWSRETIADWLCRVGGCKHELTEEPTIKSPRGYRFLRDWIGVKGAS